MNETHIMNDFWKFDLLRKTWERLPQDDPYSTQFMNLDLTGKIIGHFIQNIEIILWLLFFFYFFSNILKRFPWWIIFNVAFC